MSNQKETSKPDNAEITDKFLSKHAALDLFNRYGYDISMSTFHRTIWQKLTKKPVTLDHTRKKPSTLRVLKSECMRIIRRDINKLKQKTMNI